MKRGIASIAIMLALTACGSGTAGKPPTGVKVGKPYQIMGETYYPEYDPHYDKTGTASWYGPGFHGKSTANGERFDQDDLTAAHPTLPMPSLVRVTNLENGMSTIVRVNDRGPFKDKRLIDLSRGSAKALGITGLAKVRVQYLKEETESYWAKMNLKTNDIEFARNDPYAPSADPGLDGVIVAKDEESSPQVKSAAPVMSISSTDLQPEDLKVRPIQPRFSVIGEANAGEVGAAEGTLAPKSGGTQVVQLVGPDGKPVGSAAKRPAPAAQVTETTVVEETVTRPAVDTSIEATTASNESPKEVQMASLEPVREPGIAGGAWYVQAGSFASEENASRLASQLEKVGPSDMKPVDVKGTTWYRVRVGPFASREEAETAASKSASAGAAGARVVQD